MGGRYKLVKHPQQPIGIAKTSVWGTKDILVVWEDQSLIPPSDQYPEDMFADGSFVFVGYPSEDIFGDLSKPYATTCRHEWKTYVGFREEYDYCQKCNVKRGT